MTQDRGAFRVVRELFDHPELGGEPYDKRSAWLSLIADAAWQARKVNCGGRIIELHRGQLAHSHRFLATKWGWEHKRVARFLEKLSALDMIRVHVVSGIGILSIVNYDRYQSTTETKNRSAILPGQDRGSDAPQNGAVNGAVKNDESAYAAGASEVGQRHIGAVNGAKSPRGVFESRGRANKQIKESKNPSSEASVATVPVANHQIGKAFEEWWSLVPPKRRVERKAARIEYTRIVRCGEATVAELAAGMKDYAIECVGKPAQYIKHPATWLKKGCWADERAGAAIIKPTAWPECVELYKRRNFWPPNIGPAPGQPGCRAPHDVLAVHGFAKIEEF
jgi:hypothetical protein